MKRIKDILYKIGGFIATPFLYLMTPFLYVAFMYGDKHGWFDEVD